MTNKTVKWKDIVSNAKTIKAYVEKNQKGKNIEGLNAGETLYVMSKAVKNPGKDVVIPGQIVNCKDCTGSGIYENLEKDDYLKVASKVLTWFKTNVKAPNYIGWGKEKISVRLANYAFSKIIAWYDNNGKKLPSTCWFANAVFNTKASQAGNLVSKLQNISKTAIKTYKDVYNVFVKFFYYDYYYDDKQTQSETLSRRKGNCVDLNQIMYHVLKEMGYTVRIVRGTVKCTDGVYGHVWTQIKLNGSWVNIDASAAAREKALGTVICASVVSITNINDAWMVNDTGDM